MNEAVSRAATGFALVTTVVVAVTVGSAVIAHRSAEKSMRSLVGHADDLTTAARSEVAAEEMIAAGRGYLLTREPALLDRVRTREAELDAALATLERRSASPTERGLLSEVRTAAARYVALIERSFSDPAIGSNQQAVADLFRTRLLPARAELEARTRRLVDEKARLQRTGRTALRATAWRAFGAVMALGVLGAALALVLAWRFTRRLGQLYLRERAAAARALRAADAARDLIASVAHDLRNPLGAIAMHVTQLGAVDDPGSRKNVRAIDRISRRMERFIGDLLDAASLEAGVSPVVRRECSVVEMVERTAEDFREQAADKHIALRWQVDDVQAVWADPVRLPQVLANLVGNAIKFTPPRGTVQLRARRWEDTTRFEVRDTGPGIALEDLAHLFDRYWKGRSSGHRGVGLGLYIAKGIVEGHGGRIWVETAMGSGSTFVFTVPGGASPAATDYVRAGSPRFRERVAVETAARP